MVRTARFVRASMATLAFVIPSAVPAQQEAPRAAPAPLAGVERYIERALAAWEVPGVAVAVVKDDAVVWTRGFGVRKVGAAERVDDRTIFAIGSATKAFTAATVALMVDEGKVRWDDPASQHVPGLRLADPYASYELTVRDLLSHRSGLARGDRLWYGSAFSRDEILRRVRFLEPSWSFRSQFGYQNLMYLAAGQVVANAAHTSWDDVVRQRLMLPIGMSSSSSSVRALAGKDNVAQPHARLADTVRAIAYREIDNIAPAGSINSNAVDMAKWVRFQLARGRDEGGRQLLSTNAFREMWAAHTAIRIDGASAVLFPDAHLMSYGLGWFLQDYRGKLVVQHGGNIDGMTALVGMLPEEQLGVVVLSNMNGSALPSAILHTIFDRYLGSSGKDWSAILLAGEQGRRRQATEAAARVVAQRIPGTRPSLPLARYAGTYVDSMYGEVVVREQGGGLAIAMGPAFDGTLEHWHLDTFRATWRDPFIGPTFVTFVVDQTARVARASVENLAEFRRRPTPADTTSAVRLTTNELLRFTGRWAAREQQVTVDVQLVDGALRAILPGQPLYRMVPVTPSRFRLTGPDMPDGYFLDFVLEDARPVRARLVQPAPRPTVPLVRG